MMLGTATTPERRIPLLKHARAPRFEHMLLHVVGGGG